MPLTLATVTPGEPEIFASVQGEGPSSGAECAFIRLSRCNLACVWCDTAYTWHFEGDARPHRDGITYARTDEQVTLTEQDAASRIAAFGKNRLVITGGEPLLQAAALTRMLAHLPGVTVEIETNGTVRPPETLDRLVSQYNVSPKLSHSGNPAELALIPQRLSEWVDNSKAWFKFVVASPADGEEALRLADAHAIPRERMMLMAEGTDTATLSHRETWLAPFCAVHSLTMSKRLHIEMFGDSRGT